MTQFQENVQAGRWTDTPLFIERLSLTQQIKRDIGPTDGDSYRAFYLRAR